MQYKEFSHQYWMYEAIKFAKVSNLQSEVPVCALVVKGNKLISKTVNKIETLCDATLHAEILAIREASKVTGNWRLNGCAIYTTLEPCAMCAGAILNSRISILVFGAYDLNNGACGSVVSLFSDFNKQNLIEVVGGVLELEASQLLKQFFAIKRG